MCRARSLPGLLVRLIFFPGFRRKLILQQIVALRLRSLIAGGDQLFRLAIIPYSVLTRIRRQQDRVDIIGLEQVEKQADIPKLHGAVIGHLKGFAIELRAPVDEHRNALRDQIARERQVVHDPLGMLGLQHFDRSRGRLVRRRREWMIGGERPGPAAKDRNRHGR